MGYNVIGMWETNTQCSVLSAQKKGFTLIELIVVMSLIVILASLGIGNFMGSQKRGRDVRRQSDLNQYRIALENYASVNGSVYPAGLSGTAQTVLATPLANYMSGFPADLQGGYSYRYVSSADGSAYVLDACVEVQKKLFEMCSNGKSGVTTSDCTVAADSTCDL